MRVLGRRWTILAVVSLLGGAGGCDAERGGPFDCDSEAGDCGWGPPSDAPAEDDDGAREPDPEPDADGGDDGEGCDGEGCDPGPGEPGPEPSGDDDSSDPGDDDTHERCEAEYDACLESGVPAPACEELLDYCENSGDDDDDDPGDPACAEIENSALDPFGGGVIHGCFDGEDADCDGLYDCDDPDCQFVCSPGGGDPGSGGGDYGDHCDDTPDVPCYGCACIPGTERDCHVPGPCTWGKSVCQTDGTWGACEETSDIPPACDPIGGSTEDYDVGCCVAAGHCCENLDYDYDLYDPTQGAHASVGNCGQVCAEPTN